MAVSFRNDGGIIVISASLADEKIQELVELIRELADQQASSFAKSSRGTMFRPNGSNG